MPEDGGAEPEVPTAYTEPLASGEWEAMELEARKRFMIQVVLPAMSEAFREFDAERFAAVSCKTCHGSGVLDGSFHMPSADLPVLTSQMLMNPPEDKQAITEFMRTVVKPKLATLLGIDAADAAPVRCSTCHTVAQ